MTGWPPTGYQCAASKETWGEKKPGGVMRIWRRALGFKRAFPPHK
jgi:hypothetical protein